MPDFPPPSSDRQPPPPGALEPTTMSIGPPERQGWVEHKWAARAVGAVAYLVPFLASVAAAFALSSLLPVAPNLAVGMVRWLGVAIVSTIVLLVVERQTRRLMPLRTLLGLTLAFPDKAPSRFKIAIRTGTTAQLRQRLAEARDGRLGDTPSEAAERLLELVGMLSQHDRLTRGHSERVRAYSHMIGAEMGLAGKELDRLRWAGLLHDVGKLTISTDILNKPGKLTAEEFDIIKSHPMEGKALVEPLADWLGEAARAVWEHHERFDGGGYPQGLAGTEISQAARIVSVADVFDVITSIRSYKAATSASAAREELARCAGTQFDPEVVRAFLALSVGKIRRTMGPLSWAAQLAFLPGAVAAQAGPALAAAAVVTAGATAGTVGIVVDPAPAIAERQEFVATVGAAGDSALRPDATVILDTDLDTGLDTDLAATSSSEDDESTIPTPTTITIDDGLDPQPSASTTTITTITVPPESDPTTTLDRSPAVTTLPPGAATTTTTTSSTTTTTSTSSTTSTTSTTTPAPAGDTERLYLTPSAAGDHAAQSPLPLTAGRPAAGPLFNYDTDRDDSPGLLLAKDGAGINGTDPTKVLIFRSAPGVVAAVDGSVLIQFDVAAKDFARTDLRVQVQLNRCDGASCIALGTGDRTIRNAEAFKKFTIDFDGVQTVLAAGEVLEVKIAVLGDSGDDAWIAFGTRVYDGSIRFD